MKTAIAFLLAMTCTLAACDDGAESPRDGSATEGAAKRCDPKLDAALRGWADAGFSGSIAISAGGELRCAAAYGVADRSSARPNTPDTVFAVGSISKSFTAAAVLDLADAGKLSFSDRVGELMPELDGEVADATVEQLLLHTSGLVGSHGSDHRPLSREQAVAALNRLPLAFQPGSDFAYSNAGYTLLALIIDKVSGMEYREYVESRILRLPDGRVAGGFWDGEPAAPGPRAVGYLDNRASKEMGQFGGPHWALSGNGDLAMTTPQLAAWTHALFTGGIVPRRSVQLLRTLRFEHGNGQSEAPGWVAYDASTYGTPFLASAGGGGDTGHNVVVVWIPEGQRVITIASNTPRVTAEDLLDAIGPALAAGERLPAPRTSGGAIDPAEVRAVAGTYELESGGSFEVRQRAGRLSISADGADAIAALFPVPEEAAAEVATHEDQVRALVAGKTDQGREDREFLESQFGPVTKVEILGTIVYDGEQRTYVVRSSATTSVRLWFTLSDHGAVDAAEAPADPPALPFVPAGDRRYRPDDPAGTGPELTVEFDGGRMTISGGGRTVAADRSRASR